VVFFYTRCDNPLKCSLTITKLARVQRLLEARGLTGQIRTAAITYDPGFDISARMRRYGQDRGVRLDDDHRLLRAPEALGALRGHFGLGVNFIESLVNRHRIELFVLDPAGRIAARFERIRWDERKVVERAAEVLREVPAAPRGRVASPVLGTIISCAAAFFPKCPVCWAAYASTLGIAGASGIPYPSGLEPVLLVLLLINVAAVWFRARHTGSRIGAHMVTVGAGAIILSRMIAGWQGAAFWGVGLTVAGSLVSALRAQRSRTA
jgi:protein SCO1/2